MKVRAWALAGLASVSLAAAAQAQGNGREAATQAVLDATNQFARDYGAGAPPRAEVRGASANPSAEAANNLEALVDQFAENATYAGTLQPFWLRGKAQIRDLWSRYFARYPDRRMIFRDREAQVFGDSAVETGYAEMFMGTSALNAVPTFLRYSITRTLRDGKWLIVSMIVDRLPSEQPAPGTMPPWANAPLPTP